MSVATQLAPMAGRLATCGATCQEASIAQRGYRYLGIVHDPEHHERVAVAHLAPSIVTAEGLTVDVTRALVTVDGATTRLSPTELRLLLALAGADGRIVSYRDLWDQVWSGEAWLEYRRYRGNRYGTERVGSRHTVRTHITRLRRRLGAAAVAIETVREYGYRLRTQERPS